MKRFTVLALGACLLFLTGVDSLCAQMLDNTVDMRSAGVEVVTWVVGALGTVLSALGAVAIRLVLAKFGLAKSQTEQNLNDRLNDIIFKGMDYALAVARSEMMKKGSGLEAVKFDNFFVSYAASYVAKFAPGILAGFKINQGKLEDMIWARIPAFAATVPIEGGASTPQTAKDVNAVAVRTRDDNIPSPIVVSESPLPRAGVTGIVRPDTGS